MRKTEIEWTEATWNPVTGCTKVSQGCKNCYAERMAKRLAGRYGYPVDEPFRVTLHTGRLEEPLRVRKPTTFFVCSMADLFHKDVPFDYIDKAFAVMAMCPQHTFQVLTKRPERMAEYLGMVSEERDMQRWANAAVEISNSPCAAGLIEDCGWPLPNIWLGTSVEDQDAADKRIPDLLQCPAAVRFLSCEPLLGPIDFRKAPGFNRVGLDLSNWWVIAGGESGPGARPMHPDWVRSLRDQCQTAGVPFFFKQWGEWVPCDSDCGGPNRYSPYKPNYSPEQLAALPEVERHANGRPYLMVNSPGGARIMVRVGKKAAGRLLDGELWDQMPPDTRKAGDAECSPHGSTAPQQTAGPASS